MSEFMWFLRLACVLQSLVHIVDDFLLPLDIETNSAPVQAPNLALAQQTLGFASTTGRKLLLAD